ncbi:hypothetical protein CsSME_00047331 [Camellia sinensis var. sinensis]|uniref:F-box domain-containing protein n=1 Tax=Camellia sinensis var. sinensis TaxID=542762 RepID=A0A4S4ESU6_CAMSN|nr:hypothetical protein TEA_021562 [Camellia sinensis var. sinensis]
MTDTGFSKLAEDVVLNIFFKLEDDPRNWARLACVCTKFSSLIRTVCWKIKCSQTIPSVVSDLLSDSATAPLGGWASLHKLAVCCPASSTPESCWRIRILGSSERSDPMRITTKTGYFNWVSPEQRLLRAQLKGNKLLDSRFGGDCLYICDRPGCDHIEEERDYMLFRGIFKNFKKSRVWRTINDGNRSKIDLNCAFCSCKQTWDLHSAFCLRRDSGFHEDGEPVVRAYACENGHVSGAWTDWWPL